MKKIELILTDYEFEARIEGEDKKIETKTIKVDMKEELSAPLRINGIYDNGVEMVDGIDIARQIKNCTNDSLEISEQEHDLIKKVLDKLIVNPKILLGGIRHETMIERVFKAEEAKGKPKKEVKDGK